MRSLTSGLQESHLVDLVISMKFDSMMDSFGISSSLNSHGFERSESVKVKRSPVLTVPYAGLRCPDCGSRCVRIFLLDTGRDDDDFICEDCGCVFSVEQGQEA